MRFRITRARVCTTAVLLCPVTLALAASAETGSRPDFVGAPTSETIVRSDGAHHWTPQTKISLTARSDYTETAGVSASFRSIATTAYLKFSSARRPYATGVLFEYDSIESRDDVAVLAGMLSYRTGRWTMLFAPHLKKVIGQNARWRQQSAIRYRVGERASFGVELVGPIDDLGGSKLSVGYYGRFNESLSMTVLLGSGLDAGPDLAVRTALVWRLK